MHKISKALAGLGLAFAIGLLAVGGTCLTQKVMRDRACVATVNGEKISLNSFNQAMVVALKRMRWPIDEKTPEGKRQMRVVQMNVIDQLCDNKILLGEAKKRNIVASDSEVEAKIAPIKKMFSAPAKFQGMLDGLGLTSDEFKVQLGEDLIIEKLKSTKFRQLQVSEKEVRDYYAKNPKLFSYSEKASPSRARVRSFAEVKTALSSALLRKRQNEAFEKWKDELKKSFKAEINPEYLNPEVMAR